MNNNEDFKKVLFAKAYNYLYNIEEMNVMADENPMLELKNLHGYIETKAAYNALKALINDLGLDKEFTEYINNH